LTSLLAILFGGRVAEELEFGKEHITTGASNDIQIATNWARRMVTEFGFSDKLGPIRYNSDREEIFLGHSVTQQKNVADETAKLIDDEIRRFIDEAEKTALAILTENRESLNMLAHALLDHETLSGEEVKKILDGKPIRVNENENDKGKGSYNGDEGGTQKQNT
jgi:cell division protease FtsH